MEFCRKVRETEEWRSLYEKRPVPDQGRILGRMYRSSLSQSDVRRKVSGAALRASRERVGFVMALDYDQCLSKVTHGTDYAERLRPVPSVLAAQADRFLSSRKDNVCLLVSYSNRVSDFYNSMIQPVKDVSNRVIPRPNIDALLLLRAKLEELVSYRIEVETEYVVGDSLFRSLYGEGYDSEAEKPTLSKEFVRFHKEAATDERIKGQIVSRLRRRYPGVPKLFVDDKPLNLAFIQRKGREEEHTLLFHATYLGMPSSRVKGDVGDFLLSSVDREITEECVERARREPKADPYECWGV